MHLERASERPPAGLGEFLNVLGEGEGGFGGTSFGRGEADLATFLRSCADGEDPTKVGPHFVPQTIFWMIEGAGQVVGMVRLRHHLNDRLLQAGGHVGYYVRPSHRGKGYARRALRLALGHLRERGVARALVTVNPANAASIRVVLANGGKPDGQGRSADSGDIVNRYWIDL
jgi:predicted acetyltransferase